jgi:hypothetical protein
VQQRWSDAFGRVLHVADHAALLLSVVAWRFASCQARRIREATQTVQSEHSQMRRLYEQRHQRHAIQAMSSISSRAQALLQLVMLLWQHDTCFVSQLRKLWLHGCSRPEFVGYDPALDFRGEHNVFISTTVRWQRTVQLVISILRVWEAMVHRRQDINRNAEECTVFARDLHLEFNARSSRYLDATHLVLIRRERQKLDGLLRVSFFIFCFLVCRQKSWRFMSKNDVLFEKLTTSLIVINEWRRQTWSTLEKRNGQLLSDETHKKLEGRTSLCLDFAESLLRPVARQCTFSVIAARAIASWYRWVRLVAVQSTGKLAASTAQMHASLRLNLGLHLSKHMLAQLMRQLSWSVLKNWRCLSVNLKWERECSNTSEQNVQLRKRLETEAHLHEKAHCRKLKYLVVRMPFGAWRAVAILNLQHLKEKNLLCAEAAQELERLRSSNEEASLNKQRVTCEFERLHEKACHDLERRRARCHNVVLRAALLRTLAVHLCAWRVTAAERRHDKAIAQHRCAVPAAVSSGSMKDRLSIQGTHFRLWHDVCRVTCNHLCTETCKQSEYYTNSRMMIDIARGQFMIVARAFAHWQVCRIVRLRHLAYESYSKSTRSGCSMSFQLSPATEHALSTVDRPSSLHGTYVVPELPSTPSSIANTTEVRLPDSHSFSGHCIPSLSFQTALFKFGEDSGLGISVQEVSKLYAEASMLRVECTGLAEKHWRLCSEIDSVVDEMRANLRIAARASGDRKLSLEQATRIGRWFLDVIERLRSLTSFMEKSDVHTAGSYPLKSCMSMARVCSPPGPRRGG